MEYLKSHNYPERYYNNELAQKSDKLYGFHYQLNTILFYYLFNQLRETAEKFLEVIESQEFNSNYSHLITRNEYDFEYPTVMHDEIFRYFDSRIAHFGMFHHLLNWLSDMGYSAGSLTVYKIKTIENCIKDLERFDFTYVDLLKN